MRKGMVLAGAGVMLLVICAQAMALPSVDELFEKMIKKADEIKNVSCDMKMNVDAEGAKVSGSGKMVSAYEKPAEEGKDMVRMFSMEMKMEMSMQGQAMTMQTKAVCDGKIVWMENRSAMMGNAVMVMKMPAEMANKGAKTTDDPVTAVRNIKDAWDMKVVGEEDIEGTKCYVMEGTPKEGADNAGFEGAEKLKLWVGEDDLIVRKIAGYQAGDKEMLSLIMGNLKINQDLPEGTFSYTPPPGAQVQDMTEMMKNME